MPNLGGPLIADPKRTMRLAAFITAGLAALERRLVAELAMDAVDAAHAAKP